MTEHDHKKIHAQERDWQDRCGGALQADAYRRPGTRFVLQRQFARIRDAMRLEPGMHVLDLGCGVGHLVEWLALQVSARYYGLDLSLTSIAAARRASRAGSLVVGDIEALPYRHGMFDRLVCNGAAHHLLNLRAAITEMYQLLAPAGVLVLFEPTTHFLSNSLRALFAQDEKYESPADLGHKHEFNVLVVKRLLETTGFEGVSYSFHDFLAYPLTGMYMALPFSRSRSLIKLLCRVEDKLEGVRPLRSALRPFTWRLLLTARKPR